jgi:3-deoxy-D-manno-octulosonic-acid transferase
MILFLYNAALLLGLVLSLPWWLWRLATTEKYREGLLERLGWVKRIETGGRPVVWLHAVSVGEVIAVARLVAELDAALPGYRVAISTTTRTGQALARQRFGAERVFYCPLDLPWAVGTRLGSLRPKMLVLAETEFWPNLLAGCYRRGVPVVVVNARISDRSWPRYMKLKSLWRPFLSRLTRVLAQTELDAERLRALGAGGVRVAGNLKFDVRANLEPGSGEAEAARLLRVAAGGLRIVVGGSTLEGEETALLEAWPRVLEVEPGLAMVMAVRHPERFAGVAELLARSGFRWRRRSAMGEAVLAPGEIVLLDSMGELASVYSMAAVAFVGGSVVAAGGHNPLEPAQFGVPVVMGSHYENFRGIVEAMRKADGIRIVDGAGLAAGLAELLTDSALAAGIGARGRAVYMAEGGATGRTVEAIQEVLGRVGL